MADRDHNLDYPGIDMLNRLSVAYPAVRHCSDVQNALPFCMNDP
jgi:hypothetical protein